MTARVRGGARPRLPMLALSLIWTLLPTAPVAAAEQRCIPEEHLDFGLLLASVWDEAQQAAGKVAEAPRPRVCFGWEPRYRATPQGPERILATYDAKTRRVDVSLTPEELGRDGRCVLRHEFLHALGADEKTALALQGCVTAVEGVR